MQLYWNDGQKIDTACSKVVCVGRNYAAHAKELNNPIPKRPLLFIKPSTSLASLESDVVIPLDKGRVEHELELAILIGQPLTSASAEQVRSAICGVGLGLDLTLRDLQTELKQKGHPWERAKAFDASCPVSKFVPVSQVPALDALTLSLKVNGQLRQEGHARDMLHDIISLICEISGNFSLLPGDIVLTGTPAGVNVLTPGDELEMTANCQLAIRTQVVAG